MLSPVICSVLSITWHVSVALSQCHFFWLRPCVLVETRTPSVSWLEPFSPPLGSQLWSRQQWESGECVGVKWVCGSQVSVWQSDATDTRVCVDFLCFRPVRLLSWFLHKPSLVWTAGSAPVRVSQSICPSLHPSTCLFVTLFWSCN